MTAHAGPLPVPARITLALDEIGAEGPWVDEALGGAEPMVDQWEAGELVPTRAQVEALAKLTGMPVEYFYLPAQPGESEPSRVFICDRRRTKHALTVVETFIDWDGVLQVRELTPPKPPYRPRTAVDAVNNQGGGYQRGPARHAPHDDPDAPGCCATCGLPTGVPNARHTRRSR